MPLRSAASETVMVVSSTADQTDRLTDYESDRRA